MWVTFDWKDALDILIVSCLFYVFLILLRRTHSRFIFNGITILLVVYAVARFFNLYLTTLLFQASFAFLAVVLAVIFQRELRGFFEWLYVWGRWRRSQPDSVPDTVADEIVEAVTTLAGHRIGALIVLPGRQMIDGVLQGGIVLAGKVSTPLLLSLFDPSSPGHDGAVIIEADQVTRFSVHLPLAEHFDQYPTFGTRHRAALGLAERSDALVIAVSEERGTVSVARAGELRTLRQSSALKEDVSAIIKERFQHTPGRPWYWLLTYNMREKAVAVLFALLFWAIFVGSLGSGVITRPYDVPVEFQFLPEGFAIGEMSRETVAVTLSGRTQDFNMLEPEALRVVIRLPGGVKGRQRMRIEESMISRPSPLSVVRFTPRYLEFTVQKQE